MIKKYFWILLIVISSVGALFRLINLDKNPPHLGNDEVSIAYDSYSLRTTGKDEYGVSWPLSFISHRDYKAPLYAYLNMPFNYIFGNSEYGVRFLSAISGIMAIVLLGLFGRFLGGEKLGLITASLLVLNPKSIFVSRMAYESNLSSLLVLAGVYLIFIFKKKQNKVYLLLSGLFLGFSIWAYHTEKGLVPLLITVLPWYWRKEIKFRKWLLLWLSVFIVILPIVWDFINVQMKDPFNRASSQIWYQGISIQNYLLSTNDFLPKKMIKVLIDPVYRYIEHFGIDFLFTKGMDLFPKYEPFHFGWFLLATLPMLLIGLIKIKDIFGKNSTPLLLWWLLCPVVPSLTYGEPSAVRNLPFIMPTILIMAGGFLFIINNTKKVKWYLLLVLLINFFYFGIAYYVHFPKITGDNFQYGYKQACLEIRPIETNYDRVIIESRFGSTGQYIGLPRLYFGYFGAFDSRQMLNRGLNNIGKYWIRNIDWNKETIEPKSIYIVSSSNPTVNESTKKLELFSVINKPDTKPQFLIYRTIDN